MLSKRASAVIALVPIVFACELLLPEDSMLHVGVGEALGCGGGGNVAYAPGWSWLKPSLRPDAEAGPVPVATDGFFVIDAEGYALSVEAAQASLQVVVTNEAGETVAGETKLLLNKQEGWYLFGWSASSRLEVGAKLRAELSATPISPNAVDNVGGQFALEVVGEPTPLPEPSFRFSAWLDYYLGLPGGAVTCSAPSPLSCVGPKTIIVPSTIYERTAADVTWQPLPEIVGGVAWSVRIVPSSTSSDAEVRNVQSTDYFGDALPAWDLPLGRVVFPTPAQSYCVTVVLKDLRTDQETRAEKCAEAPPTELADSDTQLGLCDASPSSSLTGAWCRLRSGSSAIAACAPMNAAGGGGSGGVSGSGGSYVAPISDFVAGASIWGSGSSVNGAGSSSSTPGSESPDSNAAVGAARTSQGCQLGGGGSVPNIPPSSALLLGLLVLRRRVR